MSQLFEALLDQHNLHHNEGRRGVVSLCKIARSLGYKDPQYFGQLETDACIGDLIEFLEDNSGAIEAIKEWIGNTVDNNTEWQDKLVDQVTPPDDEEDDNDD